MIKSVLATSPECAKVFRIKPQNNMQKESKPIFVLGCGAQKAGSTWLWEHFANHNNVIETFHKETHALWHIYHKAVPSDNYDDYQHIEHCKLMDSAMQSYLTRFDTRHTDPDEFKNYEQQLSWAMNRVKQSYSLNDYVDTYRWLSDTTQKPVGDFTPNNCLLNKLQLTQVRDALSKHFNVKVAYIMRDPVDRVLSLTKMLCLGNNEAWNNKGPHQFICELLREHNRPLTIRKGKIINEYRAGSALRQSSYNRIVPILDSVFGDDVKYLFYENMFHQDKIDEVSDFIGVDHGKPAKLNEPINKDKSEFKFSEVTQHDLRIALRGSYDFIQKRFPDAPSQWRW